jgi:hypothetical protein
MRTFGAVCFSLLLSAVPATAADQNLKEELGKIASAYEAVLQQEGCCRDYFTLYKKLSASWCKWGSG